MSDKALPAGLEISPDLLVDNSLIYTIGYPSRDSKARNYNLMEEIFQDVYNVKRLAPGKLVSTNKKNHCCLHDCSTLPGCSGSPLTDLNSGKVVGLHFAGEYLKQNWAVQKDYLNFLTEQLELIR